MENQELEKMYMNEMTQEKIYKIFGLRKVFQMQALEDWLTNLPTLEVEERIVCKIYQRRLIENIDAWNEQELSLNFIGPIFGAINFTVLYQLNWFSQRPLSGIIDTGKKQYEIIGKPDGTLSSGYYSPEIPYFAFQEYKKDVNSSGDPIGQNLAAMLVGQTLNKTDDIIYGCYVVGRLWYFMVLKGKEFAISKAFTSDDEDIFEIVKILKALRSILFKKLNIEETK